MVLVLNEKASISWLVFNEQLYLHIVLTNYFHVPSPVSYKWQRKTYDVIILNHCFVNLQNLLLKFQVCMSDGFWNIIKQFVFIWIWLLHEYLINWNLTFGERRMVIPIVIVMVNHMQMMIVIVIVWALPSFDLMFFKKGLICLAGASYRL